FDCGRLGCFRHGSPPRLSFRTDYVLGWCMTERTWIASGGKTLYGARVGILMLETRFPRIPGDLGNAETWPFPVLYKVVPGASPHRVVHDKAADCSTNFSLPPPSSCASAPTASPRPAGFCRSTNARY